MVASAEESLENGSTGSHNDSKNDVSAADSAARPNMDVNNSRQRQGRISENYENSSDDNEDDEGNEIDDFEGFSQNDQEQQQKKLKIDRVKADKASSPASGKGKFISDQDRERRREELRRARAERKRCREKERRSNVNKEYVELTALLMKIDSSGFSASDEMEESGLPSSRLDLISRTVLVLERLHDENLQLKKQLIATASVVIKPPAAVEASIYTEASSSASETASKKEVPMNHDMVGTLLIPVMVPHNYPTSRLNLNPDNSIPMSRIPTEALFPFARESRLIDGIREGSSSKYTVNTSKSSVAHRSQYPFSQLSGHFSKSYLPSERVPSVEAEAMLSLNRSMPSPSAGQPLAVQDDARISSVRSHGTRSMRLDMKNGGGSNAQQPRYSTS